MVVSVKHSAFTPNQRYILPSVATTAVRNNPDELYLKVGKNIARFRKEIHLTQADLAAKVGSTQQLIAAFEAGTRRIPLQTFLAIADILHVDIEDLLPDATKVNKPGPKPRIQVGYDRIRQLPEKKQAIVLNLIDSLYEPSGR